MKEPIHRYFALNKPRNMVSQFISPHQVGLLGDIAFEFPPGTHALGRLDNASEGLLLLTTNKKVTRLLFQGTKPHQRQYLVMVQNKVSPETLLKLQTGIPIKIKNGEWYMAKPKQASIINNPSTLCPQATDHREAYPHTWLLITLTEGKYHQVRKMVLALRHRCLRLIRLSIENITLEGIAPGEVKEMEEVDFFEGLRIKYARETQVQ
jgi:23S rRNA pseudouridine2457 synthase